jgi:RNA polymerase sigma factor (sigma-70 family)
MQADQLRLQLYLTHRPALIDYATPIVGSRAMAEDVVQEAFLRFVPATRQRPVEQPVAYLYRIVRNLALDCARQFTVERRRSIEERAGRSVATAPTPEETVLYRDELRCVGEVLATLPGPTRIAFEMYRFGDARLEDIAVRLNVSVPTAHRLVKEALMQCARALADPRQHLAPEKAPTTRS